MKKQKTDTAIYLQTSFFSKIRYYYPASIYLFSYLCWVTLLRLLFLSLMTYLMMTPTTRFQDISDAFSSNEVSLMGFSSLLFMIGLYQINPFSPPLSQDFMSRQHLESSFFPGFVQGALLAGGMILIFLLAGWYRYLGYFIQFDEAPFEITNIIMRMTALMMMAYSETFLFHFKIQKHLQQHLPELSTAILVAISYCITKIVQFDLGLFQIGTLFLVAIALCYRTHQHHFAKAAGFWSAILIVLHPLSSLPIFGNQFSGILLIKHQSQPFQLDTLQDTVRLITGGAGGPLSSLAFQGLLLLDISYSFFIKRKKGHL